MTTSKPVPLRALAQPCGEVVVNLRFPIYPEHIAALAGKDGTYHQMLMMVQIEEAVRREVAPQLKALAGSSVTHDGRGGPST